MIKVKKYKYIVAATGIAFALVVYLYMTNSTRIQNTQLIPANGAVEQTNNKNAVSVGIANPATTHCAKEGGVSRIITKQDGSQYGLCYFDDNRACEEWAMFRGECKVGGVKTTGYDTEAQMFCAWSGGRTQAVEGAMCELPSGKVCNAEAYYSGVCTND